MSCSVSCHLLTDWEVNVRRRPAEQAEGGNVCPEQRKSVTLHVTDSVWECCAIRWTELRRLSMRDEGGLAFFFFFVFLLSEPTAACEAALTKGGSSEAGHVLGTSTQGLCLLWICSGSAQLKQPALNIQLAFPPIQLGGVGAITF